MLANALFAIETRAFSHFYVIHSPFKKDSSLVQETETYNKRQGTLLKQLKSPQDAEAILRHDVVRYAQYNTQDTLGIIQHWLTEFKAVTRFPQERMQPISDAILSRVAKGHAGGKSILNALDMYCLDILLLNMTAAEYGRYTKDVHLLQRWLAARASDKLYSHYKTELKLNDSQIQQAYKKLFISR